ncbi:unnamed protein product [Rangifer tarandus platyrhynchus]|uniref:Uncharacterized protein n=1 Tax=Rangifer tarandus platyrhynchus TaxID=3082113 RepID=A0ABN8XLZ4_RANTA|nr:unnamed protein product [Rangifer tarandus platyrhynchus]
MQHGSGNEREDMRNQGGAGDVSNAAVQHQKSYAGALQNHAGAAPLQAMTLIPTGAMLPLNPNLSLLRADPRGPSAAMMSQHTFGKLSDDAGPWHTRYSLSPLQATMHSRLLHTHVNPALCCRHDKYGIYAANPWYCSLVCRLMARKMAEKEAARRMARRQALRASPGPRTLPAGGEWFSTEEYLRLTKAVLDASRRSPVVVFTKG